MTVISNQWSAFSNRVFYFALCTILFTFTSAKAQQPKKVPRIGYLSGTGSEVPNAVAFRQGLRDLGYIEGKTSWLNIVPLKESWTAPQALWRSSFDSRSI
jgi:hypothetical protein